MLLQHIETCFNPCSIETSCHPHFGAFHVESRCLEDWQIHSVASVENHNPGVFNLLLPPSNRGLQCRKTIGSEELQGIWFHFRETGLPVMALKISISLAADKPWVWIHCWSGLPVLCRLCRPSIVASWHLKQKPCTFLSVHILSKARTSEHARTPHRYFGNHFCVILPSCFMIPQWIFTLSRLQATVKHWQHHLNHLHDFMDLVALWEFLILLVIITRNMCGSGNNINT